MPDTATDQPAPAPPEAEALPPFTPAPIPKSGYADPSKAHRKVPLKHPVVFEGKTWDAIYLRKLTVAQVATCVDNWFEQNKRDTSARLAFPIYVDEAEVEIPIGLVGLLPDDEWQAMQEMGRDFVPQRFRPPPTETATEIASSEESPSDSGLNTGDTTEPS